MTTPSLSLETMMLEALIRLKSQNNAPADITESTLENREAEEEYNKPYRFAIPSQSGCHFVGKEGLNRNEAKKLALDHFIDLCKQGFRPGEIFEQHLELNQTTHPLHLREQLPDYVFGKQVDQFLETEKYGSREDFWKKFRDVFPDLSGIMRISMPVILESQKLMVVACTTYSGPLSGSGSIAFYHLTEKGLREVSCMLASRS